MALLVNVKANDEIFRAFAFDDIQLAAFRAGSFSQIGVLNLR